MRKVNWKLVLGIMCIMGAMSAFADGTEGGFESLVAGALLIAWWYLPGRKASKNAVEVVSNENAAPMQYVIVVPCAAHNLANAIPQGYINAEAINIER